MMRWRMIAAFAAAASAAAPAAAQVDYHKAQQAGKVWERKSGQNDRRGPRRPVDNRPITAAERSAALTRHRADYDRLVRSVGTDNADKWLGFKVRQMRRGD